MKKIFIILWSLCVSFNLLACEFTDNKEYTIQNKNIIHAPNIMEFFSFFCPYCYEFEKTHNIRKIIKNIDKNIKIQTYHVDFLGGELSCLLTKSWIIAQILNIEDKIMLPIFRGIQETKNIKDLYSIKILFKKEAGINENKFDNFWNSFMLKRLVQKNKQNIEKVHLKYIPAMLIHGKYLIDYSILEKNFKNHFTQKYIRLITFLLHKK